MSAGYRCLQWFFCLYMFLIKNLKYWKIWRNIGPKHRLDMQESTLSLTQICTQKTFPKQITLYCNFKVVNFAILIIQSGFRFPFLLLSIICISSWGKHMWVWLWTSSYVCQRPSKHALSNIWNYNDKLQKYLREKKWTRIKNITRLGWRNWM